MGKFNDYLESSDFYKSGAYQQGLMSLAGAGMTSGLEHMNNPYGTVDVGFNPMNFVPYALGGMGEGLIEAEGGEVKETAEGEIAEYEGPSHAQGGIKDSLNKGDVIFSKRIKIGKKSLAQRKIDREKKMSALVKAIDRGGHSKEKFNTLKRTKMAMDLENQKDLMYQQKVNELKMLDGTHPAITGKGNKMAYGTFDPIQPPQLIIGGPNYGTGPLSSYGLGNNTFNPNIANHVGYSKVNTPYARPMDLNRRINQPAAGTPPTPLFSQLPPDPHQVGIPEFGQSFDDNLYDKSNGNFDGNFDALGNFGTAFNGIAPLINTLKNGMKDKPNINPNLDVNKDAIGTVDSYINNLDYQLSQDKLDNIRGLTSINQSMMNNSRGISSMRAGLSLNQARYNKQNAKAKSAYLGRLNQALSQKASLQSSRSIAIAKGEFQRDQADRQDRDNRNTQMAKDLGNLGYSMQQFASNKNQQKTQAMVQDAYERYKKGAITINQLESLLSTLSTSMNIQGTPRTEDLASGQIRRSRKTKG